ncbi:MAG TPA: hypothetical protein VIM02_02000 [Rhizomicrobium sp.]|jgi:hypothetical protein
MADFFRDPRRGIDAEGESHTCMAHDTKAWAGLIARVTMAEFDPSVLISDAIASNPNFGFRRENDLAVVYRVEGFPPQALVMMMGVTRNAFDEGQMISDAMRR